MDIKLHNSAISAKQVFTPIDPMDVRVYFCGPTVYDLVHIGNLRAFLNADILVRVLRTQYPVTFVRNITDIDDKIIQRANERSADWRDIAQQYSEAFEQDIRAAGLIRPDYEPKATDHMAGMIDMASELISLNAAYPSNGSVYFDSSSDLRYGHLSQRQNLGGLTQDHNPDKKSPKDFAILKAAKPNEPSWPSPWGPVRPGWHTECAVMSRAFFGKKFDIHGGGQDLFFPHHECEDTLCRALDSNNQHMANYWIHNSMLNVDGKKMSKSLGNFLTIRDVLEKTHPEVLRMFLMSSHYRSEMNFTWDAINTTKKLLDRLYRFKNDDGRAISSDSLKPLYNDLDTPAFLADLNVLSHQAANGDVEAARKMTAAAKFIGLLQDELYFKGSDDTNFVERLVVRRSQAKLEKDWAKADTIRKILNDHGYLLEDTREGTTWRKK